MPHNKSGQSECTSNVEYCPTGQRAVWWVVQHYGAYCAYVHPTMHQSTLSLPLINPEFDPIHTGLSFKHRHYFTSLIHWFYHVEYNRHSSVFSHFSGDWPVSGCDIIGISNSPADVADHIRIVLVMGQPTVGLVS